MAFLCNELHISPNLLYLTIGHDCPVSVDKHGSVKILPHPLDPLGGDKGQIFKFHNN